MKLSKITEYIDGVLISDGEFEDMNYCTADINASFLSFIEKEKFIPKINKNVTCLLCKKELVRILPDSIKGIFITEQPKYIFHRLYNEFFMIDYKKQDTIIGENCNIDQSASIAPQNVIIGDNVTIGPNVSIYENCIIKKGSKIHANAIIGGKSFSPARDKNGDTCGLVDNGKVIIDENVEICSGTHIAKGIWENDITYIGKNTMLDAMCHIAHGVKIGSSTFLAAGAVVGGNTTIGDKVWIGLNATVSNRISVGSGSRISLGAVVTKNVEENQTVTGNFAIDHDKFIKIIKEITK